VRWQARGIHMSRYANTERNVGASMAQGPPQPARSASGRRIPRELTVWHAVRQILLASASGSSSQPTSWSETVGEVSQDGKSMPADEVGATLRPVRDTGAWMRYPAAKSRLASADIDSSAQRGANLVGVRGGSDVAAPIINV